jgi:hypothetical protein
MVSYVETTAGMGRNHGGWKGIMKRGHWDGFRNNNGSSGASSCSYPRFLRAVELVSNGDRFVVKLREKQLDKAVDGVS